MKLNHKNRFRHILRVINRDLDKLVNNVGAEVWVNRVPEGYEVQVIGHDYTKWFPRQKDAVKYCQDRWGLKPRIRRTEAA